MTYDGKRADELTDEELEAAYAYCTRTRSEAAFIWEANGAALDELSEEIGRRRKASLN